MAIDFSPVKNGDMKMIDFAKDFSIDDLRQITNDSIDHILSLISDLNDADVVFDPNDPDAKDDYAVEGEEHIGWNIAHLVAHVTASSEEGAAISSILARGVPVSERPRYETPWKDITTKAHCIQRLEESRRMRLAYLDTWPDAPFMDVYREVSPRFTERVGLMNAPASFLFGLSHEVGHYEQIEEVKQQALKAKQQA